MTSTSPTPATDLGGDTSVSAPDRYVYRFGAGLREGDRGMGLLLGNKGAHLSEMARIGLPVPPGFIVTTEACKQWWLGDRIFPVAVLEQVDAAMSWLELEHVAAPGADGLPLLVSVRSGAPVSMPGMMDTVLDLGLRDEAHVDELAANGNARLVRDAWRRFLQMFGSVVLGVDAHEFDAVLTQVRADEGVVTDAELTPAALQYVGRRFMDIIEQARGADAVPNDPREQLLLAIGAVFDSWNGEPARVYRAHHGIADDLGTAVNVQRMVFGNAGDGSASGVLFTRNPATGEARIYGEYLSDAQGEDVVSGMRTPQPLSTIDEAEGQESLERIMPEAWEGLRGVVQQLEQHYRDVQDVEFTVERGQLWVLQTRSAKRTARAALHAAVDMADEALITRDEALLRVDAGSLTKLLVPQFDPQASREVLARGIAASPGAASGAIAVTAGDAVARAARGERVVLVRGETSAADIAGMLAASGVLTARGGATSHAAVVARGMGTPCVVGCGDVDVDELADTVRIGGRPFRAGEVISIDGATGEVLAGEMPCVPATIDPTLGRFLGWADAVRTMGVRANADIAEDARRAHQFGAEGIGLCRTEHMFFAPDRLPRFTMAVIADSVDERRAALAGLADAIEGDFLAMFEEMEGHPVTIRLLDPPLHEFLPRSDQDLQRVASEAGVEPERIAEAARHLHEANPMLGHRGVRLAITHPEIYEALVTSIVRAVLAATRRGVVTRAQIMIPLVGGAREMQAARALVDATVAETFAAAGATPITIPVGAMIEVPRACVLADRIVEHADFLSFGTNDLTQLTYGFSRDDAGSFLPAYRQRGLLDADPFVELDRDGVGGLVELALERARTARPGTEVGVCGEHGADPSSIEFFQQAGVDYVSCSPTRVPVARLAAAQAALRASPR